MRYRQRDWLVSQPRILSRVTTAPGSSPSNSQVTSASPGSSTQNPGTWSIDIGLLERTGWSVHRRHWYKSSFWMIWLLSCLPDPYIRVLTAREPFASIENKGVEPTIRMQHRFRPKTSRGRLTSTLRDKKQGAEASLLPIIGTFIYPERI